MYRTVTIFCTTALLTKAKKVHLARTAGVSIPGYAYLCFIRREGVIVFIRKWVFRYGWLVVIGCFNLVQLMAANPAPVRANPFDAYGAFMPGQDIQPLLQDGSCNFMFSMPYNHLRAAECAAQTDLIESMLVSVDDDGKIDNIYIYLEQCAVKAGDLMLWYETQTEITRHGTRRIRWKGGQASSGYPTAGYWTPNSCVWGIWFDGKTAPPVPGL